MPDKDIVFDCESNLYEIFAKVIEQEENMRKNYGRQLQSIVVSIHNGQSTVVMKFK